MFKYPGILHECLRPDRVRGDARKQAGQVPAAGGQLHHGQRQGVPLRLLAPHQPQAAPRPQHRGRRQELQAGRPQEGDLQARADRGWPGHQRLGADRLVLQKVPSEGS